MADIKFPRSHSYFITLNHIYLIAFIFSPPSANHALHNPSSKAKNAPISSFCHPQSRPQTISYTKFAIENKHQTRIINPAPRKAEGNKTKTKHGTEQKHRYAPLSHRPIQSHGQRHDVPNPPNRIKPFDKSR